MDKISQAISVPISPSFVQRGSPAPLLWLADRTLKTGHEGWGQKGPTTVGMRGEAERPPTVGMRGGG